jgi:hypothetical protein
MMHLISRMALLVLPPAAAFRVVRLIGRRVPISREDAQAYARSLRRGTCLSRSMTVAARLPNARVVIGVNSNASRPVTFATKGGRAISAHAWVDVDGEPLLDDDAAGEIVGALDG